MTRAGERLPPPPKLDQKRYLVWQFSAQQSQNLPYHVKTIALHCKKALKKEQFHPQNMGNGTCQTLHLKIFPGEDAPGPLYNARG